MNGARTLLDRLWSEHVIVVSPQGEELLYVDFNLINEGQSFLAFDQLRKEGRRPRRPQQHLAVTDHYLPTVNRSLGPAGIANPEIRHVLATQTVWLKKPKTMRIGIEGALPPAVTAKDVILSIIREIGVGGATGYAVEYAGSAVRAMSMEGRMTICNMSIEAGARIGMIGPDDATYEYLAGRPNAPTGADWTRALAHWSTLPTDAGVAFDRELAFDAGRLAPMVSWGTSPEDCSPVDGVVPDPSTIADGDRRRHVTRALDYMRLRPSTPLQEISIDRVFIGSCTNSRIEDLRAAARVLKGRRTAVPGMVSPGSSAVKRQAESEGLDAVFCAAGLEWRDAGCSMCNGSNGELVAPGERCASTTNRNYEGRQGRGALTHIMSPSMVAAAAVFGRITDVRRLSHD